MDFVEEHHQLRLFAIADLGQLFEELREQLHENGRVHLRTLVELVGSEEINDSLPFRILLRGRRRPERDRAGRAG